MLTGSGRHGSPAAIRCQSPQASESVSCMHALLMLRITSLPVHTPACILYACTLKDLTLPHACCCPLCDRSLHHLPRRRCGVGRHRPDPRPVSPRPLHACMHVHHNGGRTVTCMHALCYLLLVIIMAVALSHACMLCAPRCMHAWSWPCVRVWPRQSKLHAGIQACVHALCYYPPRMHGCPDLPFRPFPDRPNGAALLSDPDLPAVINVHISTGAVMTERAWCGLRTEAGPA